MSVGNALFATSFCVYSSVKIHIRVKYIYSYFVLRTTLNSLFYHFIARVLCCSIREKLHRVIDLVKIWLFGFDLETDMNYGRTRNFMFLAFISSTLVK